MLQCSDPTIRRKNSSVFFHWSCASSFLETFAAELDFFSFLIEAAIGFTAQSNHFGAALIVLDIIVTTNSWEKVTDRVGGNVVAIIVFSYIDPSFSHFRFYTVFQRLLR